MRKQASYSSIMEPTKLSCDSCPVTCTSYNTECLDRLTEAFRSFKSSSCPSQSLTELAPVIHSGVSSCEGGEYCHSNELSCMSLSLVEKIVSSLTAHNLTPELTSYCAELLRVLFRGMDLMSSIVNFFHSPDQIVSHLAAKTASSYVSYQLHTSGTVSQAWQQKCELSFLTSVPSPELDACMWSLTAVLKRLVKGCHQDLAVKVLETFDTSICIVCSQLLPLEHESVYMMDNPHWATTFCILLNLLEVLTASAALCTSEARFKSQRLTHILSSALLKTVIFCTQYTVKKTVLLLLKRVLLQKPGDDWLSGGALSCTVKHGHLDQDTCVLSHSVIHAVTTRWLQTLEVRADSYFGGTSESSEQKKDCVMLRAVSIILLKATEIHTEAGAPSGSPAVAEVLGYLRTLWNFLRQQSVQMLEVSHSCCFLTLLFVEQDDDLMEAAASLLSIFLHCRTSIGPDSNAGQEDACVSGCNPHCQFLLLLQSISFDHSILLDFLISMETCFLEYFVRYLKYFLSDWQGFTKACRKITVKRTKSDCATRPRLTVKMDAIYCKQTHGVDPGFRLVEYDSSEESDVDSMEVSEGSGPLSVPGASLVEPHELSGAQVSCDTLAQAVDCLSQLREVVTRLHTKKLFPYNPSSLLRLLAKVNTE